MRRVSASKRRRGTILPLVVVSLVALVGFVALAIDIGLLMVARTHCQQVADCAAMAGARTLNGDVNNNNNYASAGPMVNVAATSCRVLNQPVQSGWVTHEIGYYTYNRTTSTFGPILPSSGGSLPSGENWSLVRVQVNFGSATKFARVFGINMFQTGAVATAVHRPRDVCIIMDYSGSMSFDSLLGGDYSGNRTQSLNPESVRPQFGHYVGYNPVASAGLVLGSGEVLGLSNITVDTDAGNKIVNDYFQNALGAPTVLAFSPADSAYASAPAGDVPLRANNNNPGDPFEDRLSDILGQTTYHSNWETNGYSWPPLHQGSNKAFDGYTMGPSYWGKTFWIWPPDPRTTHDWRKNFFFKSNGTTPVDDNSVLWNTGSTPTMKVPRTSTTTNYYINYAAILRWLKTTGPNPFPNQLRAGKISYYTAIPDVSNTANDAALNGRFYQTNPADLNERFWKHFIDFVLGFEQTGTSGGGPVYTSVMANIGYSDDYSWGTQSISAKPVSPDTRYMNYTDNPRRPKTRFWFGPMNMVDFLDNYNQNRRWCAGTVHQAPLWGCKVGMRAAILDIQKNHPNDYVALSFFSTPQYSSSDTNGKFNRVRAPLGRSYQRMVDSLFYPPATIDDPSTYPEINCYDSTNMREVPRANGSTCPVMGLMHAYNQFSSNPTLVNYNPSPAPAGDAGGLGRVGAQKMVILMTDGVANTSANASLVNAGANQSYYRIRIPGEYPSNSSGSYSGVDTQIYGITQQLCALDTAATPGYSTARKPVIIHCIAYGSLFDPAVTAGASAARNSALTILQTVQYYGKTQASPSTPLQSYKTIIGTSAERVTKMQQAFQTIMQDSVSVTLIE